MPGDIQLTAQQDKAALFQHFTPRWAMLTEVTAATQERAGGKVMRGYRERRIDVLLVRPAVRGLERMAIEVKVGRSDFLQDVRNPDKQASWRALANRHAYAVPLGLVSAIEVPADSGLLTVRPGRNRYESYVVEFARRAPMAPAGTLDLPMPLVMDAFHRASRAEGRTKGLSRWLPDGVTEEELRGRIATLERDLANANGRAQRADENARRWRLMVARQEPPACGTCGLPLRPARSAYSRHRAWVWEHSQEEQNLACRKLDPNDWGGPWPADDIAVGLATVTGE